MKVLAMLTLPFSAFLAALLTLFFLTLHIITTKTKSKNPSTNLPPGSFGWPFLGETLEFLKAYRDGKPESYVKKRMIKYNNPPVFKTAVLTKPTAVFCGPKGNKFLFSNENKVVAQWWPASFQRLFRSGLVSIVGDEAKRTRSMLLSFLNPDALVRFIKSMDVVTQHHIRTHWEGKEEVKVYPTIKLYTFELACRLFMSIEDPKQISKLSAQFNVLLKGLTAIPLNIPGTRFYHAMRAASVLRKELQVIAREKRMALEQKRVSPSQDLLSHLLVTVDENGRFMSEEDIINNILALLFASHDTSTSVITMLMKYLAELPQVYQNVLREQIDIALSKGAEEMLQWDDIQKMRYSWNVVSEVMRISPAVIGGFKEALVDFTFEGYTIPKGWKLHWCAASTHIDPNLFPSEAKFDASRFEGGGPPPFSYVPFGGGPRMCLGKGFARIQILLFLHNVMKRFKWDLVIPDEKIEYDPMPTPAQGLSIRLKPQQIEA